MRLTDKERARLDCDVLRKISKSSGAVHYYVRNCLDWPGAGWHRVGLTTPDISRSCHRLERFGFIAEAKRNSFAFMKAWDITDAGRQQLEASNGIS